MATINHQTPHKGNGCTTVLWETLTGGDQGEAIDLNNLGGLAASVQATGTFGGTVTMQVSNDGVTWFTMKDTQAADVTFSANGFVDIATAARFIRPDAGVGVSDVDVHLVVRNG